MTILYVKNNPSGQKRSGSDNDPNPDVNPDLLNHTPHGTSGSEGVSEIGINTPPTVVCFHNPDPDPDLLFSEKLPPNKQSLGDLNAQIRIDIDTLYQSGIPYQSMCWKLKTKYKDFYTRTYDHWQLKKKGSGTKHLIDETFKRFLPVLRELGFKPDGVQHIDQIIPGAGYKLGNVRWLSPAANMANKCTAPHNVPLVQAGVAKPTPNLLDAERIFDCWYYQYSKNYPDALTPERTKDVLNKINNNIISKYKANCDKVLWVIPFLIERWDSGTHSYYQAINEAHGSRLSNTPDLELVWRYITPVMLFVPPLLKAYEAKHGTFVPRWEKLELEAERARLYRLNIENNLRRQDLMQSALVKTEEHPYALYVLMAFDPKVPGHRTDMSFIKMLSELSAETGLTDEEYFAFRASYLYDFTPEKQSKIDKWFNLWQAVNPTD